MTKRVDVRPLAVDRLVQRGFGQHAGARQRRGDLFPDDPPRGSEPVGVTRGKRFQLGVTARELRPDVAAHFDPVDDERAEPRRDLDPVDEGVGDLQVAQPAAVEPAAVEVDAQEA